MAPSVLLPRLQLLGAALLFSTGGVAIKSCSLGDWQIASFRCGIAALALLLVLPETRRQWSPKIVLVGLVYAATLVCYALANKSTTAANAIFLQSAAPLYLLILAPWLLRERSRPRDVVLMLAMAAGLALCFVGDDPITATAPDPPRGNLIGAAAGMFWASTVLGLRWLASSSERREGDAVRAVVAGNVIGFVACLPMALPVGPSRAEDWLWVAFLGVFQIGLAYVLLTRAVEQVPAFEASILLLAEPVFNPIWTWMGHGEVPSPWALVGGGLILVATGVKTWVDFRAEPPPALPPS